MSTRPTGTTADDHLEIALRNTGPNVLGGFEVFYTFSEHHRQRRRRRRTDRNRDKDAGGAETGN